MRQFYSPWVYTPKSRLFHKRRFRLRHVVVPVTAILFVYGLLSLLTPADNGPVAEVATQTILPVIDNATLQDQAHPLPQALSRETIKAAFDAKPAKPTYNYAQQRSVLSQKIDSIQSGITNLLETGSHILVSTKKLVVGKGDTLMELLVKNNVPRNEAHEAIAALRKVYDPRALNPGHEITVFFHKDPALQTVSFTGLSIEKDLIHTVMVNRAEGGAYTADEAAKTVNRGMKAAHGIIDSSLYVSAKNAGVPDGILLDLIKIYSWHVDFQRDIQSGDRFEVMFEEYTTDSGDVVRGKGNIVYAKMILSGKEIPLYRYEDLAGDVGYYDDQGRAAKRPLMKTPIDGARISSGYGMRRHPVLGYSKMHKGVDFAAPSGTPIYAAGDGTITKMGPYSSYGNYVRIRHGGGIDTAYAHLRGFKKGLKSGSRVKQGEVIGYVGTTGRSTGPHLHYEVMVSGRQVSPNSLKMPTGKTLAGKDLAAFKQIVSDTEYSFASLGRNTAVAANN